MQVWNCHNCNINNLCIYPACSDCGQLKPIEISDNTVLSGLFSTGESSTIEQLIRNRASTENSTIEQLIRNRASTENSTIEQLIRNRSSTVGLTEGHNSYTLDTHSTANEINPSELEDVKFKITQNAWHKILKNSIGNKLGGECIYCISCFGYKDAVVMPCCNKKLHKNCIKTWLFKHKPQCPMCRNIFPHQRILNEETTIDRLLNEHYSRNI